MRTRLEDGVCWINLPSSCPSGQTAGSLTPIRQYNHVYSKAAISPPRLKPPPPLLGVGVANRGLNQGHRDSGTQGRWGSDPWIFLKIRSPTPTRPLRGSSLDPLHQPGLAPWAARLGGGAVSLINYWGKICGGASRKVSPGLEATRGRSGQAGTRYNRQANQAKVGSVLDNFAWTSRSSFSITPRRRSCAGNKVLFLL